jgi:protoheme IX farnesyltransferase
VSRPKPLAYLALTKPRIIELLLVTTLPTMIVAARGLPGGWLVVATLVGGSLAAGGANAINMVVDRDIDALMKRTAGRRRSSPSQPPSSMSSCTPCG